ncbi:MAG TPA: DinB family protein [Anaerolineales bacterium]|nr:DinB family protein [Anaerolineales bacterium]
MTLTLLLDLDDTLLDTNLESFVPAYFQALSQHLQKFCSGGRVIRSLVAGMNAMNANEDPRRTLKTVFEDEFSAILGIRIEALDEAFDDFLKRVFPGMAGLTKQIPEAIHFVEWAVTAGHHVAVATDPLFYREATEERLRWAGFDPDQFALVSSADDFHFTKSHPAYFAEFLGRLGWEDGPVLMVGHDLNRDIVPAQRLGLKTFHVETGSASDPGKDAAHGTLADLRAWIESVDLSAFEPSFKSRDGILGIMASTPAVMDSISASLTVDQWSREPAPGDWSMNEIACHLRDTEREVHALQLDLLIEKPDAFIPRPDSGVWASERDYLSEDGHAALEGFAEARIEILNRMKTLPETIWERKARHAIFGPTDFLEIMSFVGDHDRLHLQQAWKTLQSLRVGASI